MEWLRYPILGDSYPPIAKLFGCRGRTLITFPPKVGVKELSRGKYLHSVPLLGASPELGAEAFKSFHQEHLFRR